MRHPTAVCPTVTGTDRQLPDEVRRDHVSPVILSDGFRPAQIVGIDHRTAAAAEPLGNGVLFLAERVGHLIAEALRRALFKPQREAVVPGVAHRIAEPRDPGVLWIRFQELRGARVRSREQGVAGLDDAEERVRNQCVQSGPLGQGIGRNGVTRNIDPQLLVPRAHVGHLSDHLSRQLALEADVPRVRVWCLEITERCGHRTADDGRRWLEITGVERTAKRGAGRRCVGRSGRGAGALEVDRRRRQEPTAAKIAGGRSDTAASRVIDDAVGAA